jgi:hypothetical protein
VQPSEVGLLGLGLTGEVRLDLLRYIHLAAHASSELFLAGSDGLRLSIAGVPVDWPSAANRTTIRACRSREPLEHPLEARDKATGALGSGCERITYQSPLRVTYRQISRHSSLHRLNGAHQQWPDLGGKVPGERDPLPPMLGAGEFEPYIRHIRFPHFRNLRDGVRIDFNYPVTALVGPNGTNKTAILRALQGCPGRNNIGLYWFSTILDPIREIGKEGRHRFIYGYLAPSVGEVVEVVKTRISREGDPDYFEPARPIIADGMLAMPPLTDPILPDRTGTRWRTISKRVLYLDFRGELSAFDKYFYHTPYTKRVTSLPDKKKFVRTRTRHLADCMEGRPEFSYYGKQRVVEPVKELESFQVREISRILGHQYESIKVMRHRFFDDDGYSVLLREGNFRYSEAFAGSGEFAVTMLVRRITEAAERSLVLLDEPEVSLHPGAQRGLMKFIREQAKLRRHQFVISTHAADIVRDLPDEAIKVFQAHPSDGKIDLVAQASAPADAFFRLGVPTTESRTVFVEDALAAKFISKAMRALGVAAHTRAKVEILPGGAGTIQTRLIPTLALSRASCLVFLDGDQRSAPPPPLDEIPSGSLFSVVRDLLGGDPQLSLSGGSGGHSEDEQIQQLRTIIDWIRDHVAYLPGEDPESLLLDLIGEGELVDGADEAKLMWVKRARESLGKEDYEDVTAEEILAEQDRALGGVELAVPDLAAISSRLRTYLR